MIDLDDDSDNNKSDPNRKDLLRKSIIRVKKPNLPESESKLKENFTTKQYFGKNKKLIEDFFVIGADLKDISPSTAKACPEIIHVKSKILYMFSDKKDC